jgi:hypothetical protein
MKIKSRPGFTIGMAVAAILGMAAFGLHAHAETIIPTWSPETINIATASVSGTDVSVAVYKTSYAAEIADLGVLNGTYTLTFDYSFSAQGWWESPLVALATNGAPPVALSSCIEADLSCATDVLNSEWDAGSPETPVSDIRTAPYSISSPATGFVSDTFEASGDTEIWFALVPSNFSGNGDHYWTYLDFDDVSVATIPEPCSGVMFMASLGLISLTRLGRKARARKTVR